jgi:hypothetical protein
VTTPENPEKPDAKTESDGEAEKKSVATEEAPAEPERPEPAASQPAAAEPATNGAVAHEQETTKFKKEEAAAPAAAAPPAPAAPASTPAASATPPAAAPTVPVAPVTPAPAAPAEPTASSAPPPWQRVTADTAAAAAATTISSTAYDNEPVDTSSQATTNFRPVGTPESASPLDSPTVSTRTSVNLGGSTSTPPRGTAAPTALRRPGRGPRRASLQIKRVDPWSVLKLALVLGFAMFLVWMVAVGVLYSVLGGMNVWTKLNGTYNDLVQGGDNSGGDLISAGRVFGIAAVVGLVNVILFTAMATVSAFIYNVSADLAGGVEVTLSERE